jgi:selenocysteine lyase/cysteine desulfurase
MNLIRSQRELFDVPRDIAYFNCAYYSPQLNETRRRLLTGAGSKSHPWERTPHDFFSDAETVRILAAGLFGGDINGYAIIPAVSYGISTAVRVIEPQVRKGDNILVLAEEFPSNILPWQRVARECGANIITIESPANNDWTPAILERIGKDIKVVSLSTCHWTNGAIIDLKKVRQLCDQSGSILVVDATQSLGAMPFSVDQIKPDFLVAAGYKWLLCPYGFSIMYVAEKWRDSRPLEESWQARENAEDFASLANYSGKYMAGARRFDVGEKCTPTILPGAIAAMEQLKAWGIESISNSLSLINNKIALTLKTLGFNIIEETLRCPHILGASLPVNYRRNLISELRARNIFISQRGQSIRFAPHLYIDDNDIERLTSVLNELI